MAQVMLSCLNEEQAIANICSKSTHFVSSEIRGLPYMTSSLEGGGGPPKADKSELGCVNSVGDRGEGVIKSELFADVIYESPLTQNVSYCCKYRQ